MIFRLKSKKSSHMRIICIFSIAIHILQSLFFQAAKAEDFSLNSENKVESSTPTPHILEKKEESAIHQKKLGAFRSNELISKPFLEPKLHFRNLDDAEKTLRSYRNNLTIIYFFASWCTSCAADIKSIVKLADKVDFTDIKDVKIILISEDFKSKEQVFASLSGINTDYIDIVFDHNKTVMSLLGVKSLPTAFLINKEGFIFARVERNLDWGSKAIFDDIIDLKDQQPIQIDRKNVYSLDPSEDIIYKKSDTKSVTIIN